MAWQICCGLERGRMVVYYAEKVVERLRKSQKLVIFGAGLVAYEVASCLMDKPYQLSVDCFLVSERKDNPEELLGLPVVVMDESAHRIGKETMIVVAVMEKHLKSILENLHRRGYVHILPLTFEGDLWSLMQGNYFREYCLDTNRPYLTLEDELTKLNRKAGKRDRIRIYTAKCHVDRELKEDLSRYFWEIPIQAGAALTEQKICEIRDNQGKNISEKNRQYCELTALYWIWKNDCSDYAGLGHYRRHFELDEEMLDKLLASDIDVVLTIPILNFPSVGAVYKHDHLESDWKVMMDAIRILAPDYELAAREIQDGNYYYGYNMLIARKKILDSYCAWLFPILQYCEEHGQERRDNYQGRYIGFLAERLLGIYFLKHSGNYKIVHVRKHFVEG